MAELTLLDHCEGVLIGARTDRYSWWVHWAELARFLLPRRYRWLVTPNQMNRGSPINGAIIDSTGTIALRVLGAGMMSGMTSPTRPWFRLRMEGYEPDEVNPVNLWLAECEKRMMRVFQESNFYNAIAVVYVDLGCFGTGPMLIYEDFENVIRCVNPCAGEYYLVLGSNLQVQTILREITKTIGSAVAEFGYDNCSESTQKAYDNGGAGLLTEIEICHIIEPNVGFAADVPKKFPFREVFWEKGNTKNGKGDIKYLRKKGYYELPGVFPRWDVTGEDAYGRGPGMDALGDVKQLQAETRRKAQAIDKLANPAMVADVELKNKPASTVPGGVTYVTKKDGVGFKPAYENFRPPIQEMMVDIQEVQKRIKSIFFNDLFLMFQELEAEPRSAAAVDVRREEKLVMLGPVLERFQTEALDPAIDRTFAIMQRAGLFPDPPQEIQAKPIQVEYVSMLAEAQKAVATGSIERLFAFIGNIQGTDPTALDNLNVDETIQTYGSMLTVPPKIMNSPEARATIRANRQKQQQAEKALAVTKEGVDAAHTLSQTPIGGSPNALDALSQGLPIQ